MSIETLHVLVGTWDLTVDLPGAEGVVGTVTFEPIGEVLVQHTSVPVPEAPDSHCVVVSDGANLVQHYFDSRGIARLYQMTFDGRTWTLERTEADFTPLDFAQRFNGELSADGSSIQAEWHTGDGNGGWTRDFGLTYRRRDLREG